MKEHALLLSTEMVLAFLADRKQVTRRIPGPTNSLVEGPRVSGKGWKAYEFDFTSYMIYDRFFGIWSKRREAFIKVEPIYQPGNLLWFRETAFPSYKGDKWFYKADYKADHKPEQKWRPSIHMPKEACRLWAEVTTVSCERLQDITEEQAVKEGIQPVEGVNSGEGTPTVQYYKNYLPHGYTEVTTIDSVQSLWQSIHGSDSWTANPPVYAVNFNPLSKTGRPDTATLHADPDAWKREND